MSGILHNFEQRKGFTLIELVIVFAIIGLFAVVVTFRSDLFRTRIAIDSYAADSVLLLQTTQALASGGSDIVTTSRRGVSVRWGEGLVQFDDSTSGTANTYDATDAVREVLELPGTVVLSRVCAREISGDWVCSTVENLDIVFRRAEVSPLVILGGTEYQEANIEYQEFSGSHTVDVIVNQNGVIYVQ